MNSLAFDYLVGFFAGKVGGVQYEVGLIGKVPVPKSIQDSTLAALSKEASRLARMSSSFSEKRRGFVAPRLAGVSGQTLVERFSRHQAEYSATEAHFVRQQGEVDTLVFQLYGIQADDQTATRAVTRTSCCRFYTRIEIGRMRCFTRITSFHSLNSRSNY